MHAAQQVGGVAGIVDEIAVAPRCDASQGLDHSPGPSRDVERCVFYSADRLGGRVGQLLARQSAVREFGRIGTTGTSAPADVIGRAPSAAIAARARPKRVSGFQGSGVKSSRRPATVRVTNATGPLVHANREGRLVGRTQARISGPETPISTRHFPEGGKGACDVPERWSVRGRVRGSEFGVQEGAFF